MSQKQKTTSFYDFFLQQFDAALAKGDLSAAQILARQAETAGVIMEKRANVPELVKAYARLAQTASDRALELLLSNAEVTPQFREVALQVLYCADALVRRAGEDNEEETHRLEELCRSVRERNNMKIAGLRAWVRDMRRRIATCMEMSRIAAKLAGVSPAGDDQRVHAAIRGASSSIRWFGRRRWAQARMVLSVGVGFRNQIASSCDVQPWQLDVAVKAVRQQRFLKTKLVLSALNLKCKGCATRSSS